VLPAADVDNRRFGSSLPKPTPRIEFEKGGR